MKKGQKLLLTVGVLAQKGNLSYRKYFQSTENDTKSNNLPPPAKRTFKECNNTGRILNKLK